MQRKLNKLNIEIQKILTVIIHKKIQQDLVFVKDVRIYHPKF